MLWLAEALASWFVARGRPSWSPRRRRHRRRAVPSRSAYSTFLHPGADPQGNGYQIIQALLAFGTGALKGVGLGLSRQKFFYLPEANTDFIFAIIGEELGLLGTLAVVSGVRRSSSTRACGSRWARETSSVGWSPAG